MTEDVELETGSAAQVSFKGQRLFLFVPGAYEPLKRDRPRAQPNRDFRIVKPVRGKAEAGLKQGNAEPAGVEHSTLARASGFHPAQRQSALSPVVAGKVE